MIKITERIQQCQQHILPLLTRYLPSSQELPLHQAMHYACLTGGKRLRPLLVYTTAELFHLPWQAMDALACAIEFIHCYSLIHDDLPAMDNDDLRRGQPTCHKKFSEAIAILAGDALLTLAFEILASAEHFPTLASPCLLEINKLIAQSAGALGMVKGQALDMLAEGETLSYSQLCQMHLAKTGALISASVQVAALAGNATVEELKDLQQFAHHIGLAFQIQDDLLDAIGDVKVLGKHTGQDKAQQKYTFVTALGITGARQELNSHYETALNHLAYFGAKAESLRQLSSYIVQRGA